MISIIKTVSIKKKQQYEALPNIQYVTIATPLGMIMTDTCRDK